MTLKIRWLNQLLFPKIQYGGPSVSAPTVLPWQSVWVTFGFFSFLIQIDMFFSLRK